MHRRLVATALLALIAGGTVACTPPTSEACPWADFVEDTTTSPGSLPVLQRFCEGARALPDGQWQLTDVGGAWDPALRTVTVGVAFTVGTHGFGGPSWTIQLGPVGAVPGQYPMDFAGSPGTVSISEITVDDATTSVTRLRATYEGTSDTATTAGTFQIG